MRVAYYYNMPRRLPHDDSENNPYGSLLCEALERRGIEAEYTLDFDEPYLRANRGRVDVLHLNWPQRLYLDPDAALARERLATFVGRMRLARELGYKLVWTAHNLYPHDRLHPALDHEGRLALGRLCTAIIAHCAFAAEEVRRRFGPPAAPFVIPHGHFIGVYRFGFTREAARARLGVPPGAFLYGCYGNIRPYKGLEALIDAVRRLPADSWLAFSGGAPLEEDRAALHRHAAGHPRIIVRTYPKAPSEDLALVLAASDAIALPFQATTTSGTVILAISNAKPVVAPALGCLPATVDPAAGCLYDAQAPGGLDAALRAIRGRDLAAAGQAALACARRLDWDDIAARTEEAYRA